MKTAKKDRSAIRNCGGKKKGSCNTWAGATTLQTKIKVAA
jgi:hypothetical protein